MATMPSTTISSIAERYWGYAVLGAWIGVVVGLGLVRLDAYGIDEAAARALLLAWSVGDRIVSTIFVLGLPDLRALLFAPLAAYWPGSMIAAKVYSLVVTALAATLLYRWSRSENGAETALLATGLLLVAPITLLEADSLGAGPYILLSFAGGLWLDRRYRIAQRLLGGWYFTQLLWVMIAVSLHPLALAYPLALAWEWKRNPVNRKNQRYLLVGIAAATAFVLAMRMGWPGLGWLSNPLAGLSRGVLGLEPSGMLSWLTAISLAIALISILIAERRNLDGRLMHRMLAIGLGIGLVCADGGWTLLAIATLFYLGIPYLIRFNQSLGGAGFAGHRGLALAILFIALLVFMQADKAHHYAIAQNQLSPVDGLILRFTAELEDLEADAKVLTLTQWPGKTMLALRRDALPLPPDYPDSETLLARIKGADYLLFDPKDSRNASLVKNLAEATGKAETLMVEEGGVAVRIRQPAKS